MSDHSASVVVIGSINSDLTITVDRHPHPGETLIGYGGTHGPGGKGANQALAARLAGAKTAFIGAVGDDAQAEHATALLRRWGVTLDALATVPGPTGLAVVIVDAAGENTITVVPGANGVVSVDLVEQHQSLIAGAEVTIAQCEIPTEALTVAAGLTRGRFILNLAPVTDIPLAILRRADPLVVNEHEARGLLSQLDTDGMQTDAEDIAAGIRRHGVPSVVITFGPLGAMVADESGTSKVPSESVDVVDTTGAGDAFVGTLGARLAAGDNLRSATVLACRAGGLATTALGAQNSYTTTLSGLCHPLNPDPRVR